MAIDKINPAGAANAYANIQKATAGVTSGMPGGDKVSFGDVLKTSVSNSIETMHEGEKTSANAVIGKADLSDVVQAVTAAEMTLQTVVALRDRLLTSYQDIMRMPI